MGVGGQAEAEHGDQGPLFPASIQIYHITHVDNLPSIVSDGGLHCDRRMVQRVASAQQIGMSEIKRWRLERPVDCHPGDCVGDFVPFYLCPRSVMLYVIARENHPNLSYRGGQKPIVHLRANLSRIVSALYVEGRRWAFCLGNAGASYTEFRSNLGAIDEINWAAVRAHDFREKAIKEGKQAEFLVHEFFAWEAIEFIGVKSEATRARVEAAIAGASHKPQIGIKPDWYF